mmetsp:Transcript_33293/g.80494  ORF Transcript_33293/g.80494 Transcript_33293/m.80494 type:complete len:109 (+) Transcript_33293:1108-1434(+)
MFGLLYVDSGTLESELEGYGIANTKEFVIWDPAFKAVNKDTHNLEVDEFLEGQTTLSKIHPILVNGKKNPLFKTATGQVLHLPSSMRNNRKRKHLHCVRRRTGRGVLG